MPLRDPFRDYVLSNLVWAAAILGLSYPRPIIRSLDRNSTGSKDEPYGLARPFDERVALKSEVVSRGINNLTQAHGVQHQGSAEPI